MEYYIARQRISHSGANQFEGKYDDDGEPVVRRVPRVTKPGSAFIPTPADKDWLLEIAAIRPLTEAEKALLDRGKREGFSVYEADDPRNSRADFHSPADWRLGAELG